MTGTLMKTQATATVKKKRGRNKKNIELLEKFLKQKEDGRNTKSFSK